LLEERVLVRRSPNAADGRSHHLELTTAGRAMHGQIWPHALSTYEKIFAALTPHETQKLRALLDKLLAAVRSIEGETP
jgi:DNA-binding MarR family transcriptional regulator